MVHFWSKTVHFLIGPFLSYIFTSTMMRSTKPESFMSLSLSVWSQSGLQKSVGGRGSGRMRHFILSSIGVATQAFFIFLIFFSFLVSRGKIWREIDWEWSRGLKMFREGVKELMSPSSVFSGVVATTLITNRKGFCTGCFCGIWSSENRGWAEKQQVIERKTWK